MDRIAGRLLSTLLIVILCLLSACQADTKGPSPGQPADEQVTGLQSQGQLENAPKRGSAPRGAENPRNL